MLILQLILKILFQISRIRKYKKKTSRLFNLLAFFIYGTVLAPLTTLSLLFRRKKAPRGKPLEALILLHLPIISFDYSIIVATLPEPTVLPPSRIANVRPCSIAIGWMSSIVISTLSPGMHISVPAGSSQTPVTSVVLK